MDVICLLLPIVCCHRLSSRNLTTACQIASTTTTTVNYAIVLIPDCVCFSEIPLTPPRSPGESDYSTPHDPDHPDYMPADRGSACGAHETSNKILTIPPNEAAAISAVATSKEAPDPPGASSKPPTDNQLVPVDQPEPPPATDEAVLHPETQLDGQEAAPRTDQEPSAAEMPVRVECAPPPPANSKQLGVQNTLLYNGSKFKGSQKSKGNSYEVEVVLQVSGQQPREGARAF